ncbi:MAG TPA: ASKHA domain-containing protein [Candidatus Methanomethylophilaceae archaeon]|nr:ASKHA domain-containing protein [Candidatus Methanomethylophilaceae archaeon]
MTKRTVRFYPTNKVVQVEDSQLITKAAELAEVEISLPCGGKGRCGRCGVYTSPTPADRSPPIPVGMERVLACQHYVTEDLDIFVPYDEHGRIVAGEDSRKVYTGAITPIVKARGKVRLGLAVDLGTAAIAISIIDLKEGLELYSTVGDNPQSFAGDDLKSRRAYADEMGGDVLRKAVIDKINELMYTFIMDPNDVKAAVISGKPYLMESLTEVCSMTGGPFCLGGSELGLDMDDDAPTYAVKELSEDVGGDLIGGILGSDMDRSNEDILLIDIGSTVQLALGNKDSILICSSESGPALEGGNVTFGMTPSIGAIDSIQYMDGEISYTVIGGTAPQGICGSGLIDLVSEMSENGIMDAVGKFTGKGKVFDSENGPAYTVTNDIYVTEGDIAAILKAKAAVRAGAIALMKEAKTDMKGISKVVVSGSFGIFINVDNAISIGLLPSLDKDKFDFLGNASMSYAVNILISEEVRNRADEVRKIITDIDFNEETYKEEVAESYPIPIRSTKESK